MYAGPIFGIGFQKTGTLALANHLNKNFTGVSAVHNYLLVDELFCKWLADTESPYTKYWEDGVVYFDAESMRKWWQALRERIPSAKFIFTTRPLDAYIRSCLIHVAYNWHINDSSWKYIDVEKYVDFYESHTKEVMEAKKAEPDRFLVVHTGEYLNSVIAKFTHSVWSGGSITKDNSSFRKLKRMMQDDSKN